jgi:hypothetical protein
MPVVTPPALTNIPDFPALSDRAAGTYNSKAFAFGTHMADTFNPEVAALANNVKANADDAATSASTAAAQVGLATTQALAAAGSAAVAGAVAWVSGLTYALGDARYSPINLQTYRRKVAGAGTTDPSLDATNWAKAVDTGPSGSLILLSSITASAAATVDIETGFSATYDDYLIVGSGVRSSASGASIKALLKIGGAYITAGYDGVMVYSSSLGTADVYSASANGADAWIASTNNGTTDAAGIQIQLFDANSSSVKAVTSTGGSNQLPTTSLFNFRSGFGCRTAGVLSGVRIKPNSGTITGNFRLYGIAKA